MKEEILAKHIMDPNPYIVNSKISIREVINILYINDIWEVYIVDNGKLVGVFTKYDVRNRCRNIDLDLPVSSIMSKHVYYVNLDKNASEIMPLLERLGVNSVAVAEKGVLYGKITRNDVRYRYLNKNYNYNEKTDYEEKPIKEQKETLISKIKNIFNNIARGIGMMSNNIKSGISHREIAKKIEVDPYKDLVSTKLIVNPTEAALIIKDGKIKEVLNSGTTIVGGLLRNLGLSKKDIEIIFVSISPYEYRYTIRNVWTKDEKSLDINLKIEFYISNPEKFYKQIIATEKLNENKLILEDFIKDKISDEILNYVLKPTLLKMNSKDIIFGEEFQEKIRNKMNSELSKIFDKKGMKLEDSIFTPMSQKTTEILEIKETAGHVDLKEDISADYRKKEIKRKCELRDIETEEDFKQILRKNKIDMKLLDSELDTKKLEIEIKSLDIESERIEVEIKKLKLDITKLENEISEYVKDKERSHEIKKIELEIKNKMMEIQSKEDILEKILYTSSKLANMKKRTKKYLICPECNNRANEDDRFCSKCGYKF